jgi:sigma-B regulation protein RsbU (phosphoserine phosphatase)
MLLSYVNAGHNSPVILRGDEIIKLEEGSVPVGLFPEIAYKVDEMEVKPGDFLVLYTDGIVEAENPEGEQYSLDRLTGFLKSNREHEAEVIKEALVTELQGFTNRNSFDDDVTFILVKIEG